ncbi:MFS transporter [Rhizobium sp. S95]|uniref:MFS transporter n=1 Tax=Ciceribacter sichuanensis TaxID=2949647 RepID=A0AAJ1F6E0_9HYPH|nr:MULTISPECIES: MFS transporter [unclassified Ciceribacter]MCM2395577.1 MFS transporter [Ciceribacter sp. S95]MCO5955999.1 MFS transporter [Ciceribacter sp. S101]
MISARLANYLAARNIHYGWVVAGITFLTMLATAGAMGSAGVLIAPLSREFGWTTEEVSSAMAIRLALFGLLGPFAAALMNHFGMRVVIGVALTLIGGGILLSFRMTELWEMVVLWGIVVGVGTGMTALVLGATVATRWFHARRGVVVGLMTVSNATGQLIFLPLLASLTEAYGWRVALSLNVAVLALAMVIVLALMRNYPADLGLAPYGSRELQPAPIRSARLSSLLVAPVAALREASVKPVFWILFFTFFVCGLSTNGLIQTHWISICGDYGVAAVSAAGMLAMIGIFDFIGTLGAGWLSDRFDNRWLLFWFYGLRGLSLIFLSASGFDYVTLSIFAVFYGLDWVATVPPTVKLTVENFGRDKANIVFGWIFAAHQLGAATATFGAGYIRTDYETFLPAVYIAGFMCLLAALSVLAIGKTVRHDTVVQAAQ